MPSMPTLTGKIKPAKICNSYRSSNGSRRCVGVMTAAGMTSWPMSMPSRALRASRARYLALPADHVGRPARHAGVLGGAQDPIDYQEAASGTVDDQLDYATERCLAFLRDNVRALLAA
jgi:hypothetical protein